jgi:A/G-specific adenine glycosylase
MALLVLPPSAGDRPRFRLSTGEELDADFREPVQQRLVRWWASAPPRIAPWRREKNPFRILIAEMLLQQTPSDRVAAVYPSLVSTYSTPSALAAASDDELSRLLEPLGIRRRVQTLKSCARSLVQDFRGRVPETYDALVSLPGVGNYTARAVRWMAFNQREGTVDAPSGRLLARLTGLPRRREPGYDRELWALGDWLAFGADRSYFFALLDLAHFHCRPSPDCNGCPLTTACATVRVAHRAPD